MAARNSGWDDLASTDEQTDADETETDDESVDYTPTIEDDGTAVFEIDNAASEFEPADIWVDDVYTNSYNDKRAQLEGDTYGAFKEAGVSDELDWDRCHHKWTGDCWEVDADALDYVADVIESAGFSVDVDVDEGPDTVPGFEAAHEYAHDAVDAAATVDNSADEDVDIEIVYEQKNGEGTNSKTGRIVSVDYNSGWEDKPMIAFRRHSDSHYMYVQYDKSRRAQLYTGGSHSPFVGSVVEIRVGGGN